jgi:hypothetical protein
VALDDDTTIDLNQAVLLQPLERALRALSLAVVGLAVALLLTHTHYH